MGWMAAGVITATHLGPVPMLPEHRHAVLCAYAGYRYKVQ